MAQTMAAIAKIIPNQIVMHAGTARMPNTSAAVEKGVLGTG